MKKVLFSTILCFSLCLFVGNVMAQSTATSTATKTSGSGTWEAPDGTWKVTKLEAWGGGGGGGTCSDTYTIGAGGGGGAYAIITDLYVIPGDELSYSVGAGGDGGKAGTESWIKTSVSSSDYLVKASGGFAGGSKARPSSNGTTATATGGSGGSTATSVGSATKGGDGGNATIYRKNAVTYTWSNSGAGGNGANGGAGGSGISSNNNGNVGTAPGGGGSGAYRNGGGLFSDPTTGGAGASGQVKITYEVLTLHITLDANGGTCSSSGFDILYYKNYGSNLPTPTLSGYDFLGWYTTAGVQMTADSVCKETTDITLKALLLKPGAIANGSTAVAPCGNYTVYSEAVADARGDDFTYSWSYTVNDGAATELNVNKLQLTQDDLSLNQMGTYKFTRYVNVLGQKVASAGQYIINVSSVEPGEIASGSKYICPASSFTLSSTTDASTTASGTIVYEWRYTKDGGAETVVTGSNKKELTQADVSFTESGAYEFKRYATLGCATPVAATGSYTLNVVVLPASYSAPTANFTNLCVGGKWIVTGDDYNLTGVANPNNIATSFDWMMSKDGGMAVSVGGNAELVQPLDAEGSYTVYAAVVYFNQSACAVNTAPVSVTVIADPTIAVPTLTSTSVCPNGEVTMTAASIVGGVGDGYTYNWEFKADGSSTWDTVSASEATYSQYKGTTITASNFIELGDVQYRSYVSNAQGCDAYSPAVDLNIIEVAVPVVRGDTTVCPEAGKFISFKATTTDPAFSLRWFENATTSTYTETTPQVAMDNELDTTNYVAQYNPDNGCVSARVPDAIYLTYSAHLQYVDASGDLNQTVCPDNSITDIQFTHGGDCEPQITFVPKMPAGVSIDNSVSGVTTITGAPSEAGTYSYHVALLPDGSTLCAAPNYYDGTITVNPVYNVTENKAICGGGYTISDKMGHSYTFTESGTYTRTLEAVTGCDSVVTLNLYVHEWNQFGFKDDEVALATWTNFGSVSENMASDGGVKQSASGITYSGWYGSNTTRDNLTSTSSLVSTTGNSLGLINGVQNGCNIDFNHGKSIVLKTSTSNYGNIKLHFDYELECRSASDHAFTNVQLSYGFNGTNFTNFPDGSISVELPTSTLIDNQSGSFDLDLSAQSFKAVDNAENLYVKLEFSGSAKSITPGVGNLCISAFTSYFRIDNICFSGSEPSELEVKGNTIACTNQPFTVEATPPYINTLATPPDTAPVIYKWERIVGGSSTVLDETSSVLVDDAVPAGNYQYKVSVGESPCGQSATWDVQGIEPAYNLGVTRHGHVCSNALNHEKDINFEDADCQYVDGMFIVTPNLEDMRIPGIYTCQLSIPSSNPCDSVITFELEVLKALDTTIVANICLGETYNEFGFDITPTEEGITYHTSDPAWTCSTGCDSIYRLTLITSSVKQTLKDEYNVTLAAWPMDNGTTNFIPACGAKTTGSSFVTGASANSPKFDNVNNAGCTPSSDYCYVASSDNKGLRWPNLFSDWSGSSWFGGGGGDPTYTDYSGVYFEIKINPYDYENLKLIFDYKRDNETSANGQAFDKVNYYYKFSETGSYNSLGTANINSTAWASQTLDFSSAASLDETEMYLKIEFIGGNPGDPQSGSLLQGEKYLPSYITVDNVMILGDRPARATLDGTAQTCDKAGSFVCEGGEVTFTCQGDDTYFKFYVVDETAGKDTAFAGNTTLTITPTQTTTYYIKAVEQTTMCDSIWGPFNVEVVKNPTLTLTTGTLDEALCGLETLDVEFLIENATSYSLTWLTEGGVKPDGISVSDDNSGNLALGGTLTNGGSARYQVVANPDFRCSTTILSENGTISTILQPKIMHTIGEDTVCQGKAMQFVVDTVGLKFGIVPENQRFVWFTANDDTLGIQDTLNYTADEAMHSVRHYIQVKQSGNCITLDSMDIVVYDLSGDTLKTEDMTYAFNYGANYLLADSLIVPDLMHNGEPVPANLIATVEHSGGTKLYPPSMDDMNLTITWTITDICGNVHVKNQNIHFILPPCGGDMTVTDKDGNVYHTVRMGLNCWMKENLKVTKYEDGTEIPSARVYMGGDYTDSATNVARYGRLYTWYSAVKIPENSDASVLPETNAQGHVQGVCPNGWRLPDRENFASLVDIDMDRMRLAGDEYWLDGGGNNTTQFSLVGAGFYNVSTDRCENLLGNTYFWTSEEYDETRVKSFEADCHCYRWLEIYHDKHSGFSVRCVRENE